MKKLKPVSKAKGYAKAQSLKISEKTLENTNLAKDFFTDFADIILFLIRILKETFSKDFEFREFFIGLKCIKLSTSFPLP